MGSAAYLGVRDSIGLIKTFIAFAEEGKVVTWESILMIIERYDKNNNTSEVLFAIEVKTR